MTRANAVQIVLLVGTVVVASMTIVGVASGTEPAITNVTVSPEQPRPGELVTFSATVKNGESSEVPYRINSIYLRSATGSREYARAENLGSVPPGQTVLVPLTATFDATGVVNLRLVVTGESREGSEPTVSYPITLIVSERGNQLSVDVGEPVVGESTEVNVTVSNGGADPIRQLDLRIAGDGVSADNPRRLLATLDAGADRTFAYDVTFTEAGQTTVEASLEYASTSGQTLTVRQNETVVVDELLEDVAVDARVGSGGGANPPLTVEVTNFGNARLEDVQIRVTDGDRPVARRAVSPVAAETERTITLNLSGVEDAELDVTVSYETGGVAGEASTSVRYASQPGRVVLTGIDYTREGGVTTISGSASNVGLADVNSVVLRVLPGEGVEPVPPNREYFVGTVPASDFVSFDLTARVAANVSSIPIEVTYVADGVTHTESTSVSYEAADIEEPMDQTGGGGLGTVGSILLLVAVLAVAAGGVLWWRRRSAGGE